jgi:hypothetical protein
VLNLAVHEINARPRLRKFIFGGIARIPFIDRKLRSLGNRLANANARTVNEQGGAQVQEDLKGLSASARRVLADIDRAVGNE